MRNNRSTPRSVHNTPHVAQPTGRSHATRRTSNCAWLIYSTARLVGPSGIFVQMGLRWVSGMSEIDDLVGTGLDTIYSSWPCVRGSPAGSPRGRWDYFVVVRVQILQEYGLRVHVLLRREATSAQWDTSRTFFRRPSGSSFRSSVGCRSPCQWPLRATAGSCCWFR